MAAEGTCRKVRNWTKVLGVRTREAPLEKISSAVELMPVSTSEPSWKTAPVASGFRCALASMMVTAPLVLPTWTLPVCKAAEDRIGRSAKATIPRCLIKELMETVGSTKTNLAGSGGNPFKTKRPPRQGVFIHSQRGCT